jgi:hypothetical protein
MLLVNHLTGFNAAAGGAATLTFQTSTSSDSDLTTYTFSTTAIGTASSDRVVIVGIEAGPATLSTRSVSSVTIGGITAHEIDQMESAEDRVTGIFAAAVPTGTTADIVIVFNAGMASCGISVYTITGCGGLVAPFSWISATDAAAGDFSQPIDIPSQGCAAVALVGDGSTSVTWTNLTERYDGTIGPGLQTRSGASDNFTSDQNGLTVTGNFAINTDYVGTLASWGPSDVPSRLYCGNTASTTDLTTYTFSSHNIGQAHASRLVVVAVSATGLVAAARSVASMTIAGTSATKAVDEGASDLNVCEIWYAAAASGTTGDIVVTFNDSMTSAGVGVYALYNLSSSTPSDTGASTTGSTTVDLPAYGQAIGCVNGGGGTTWTGLTEDHGISGRSYASRGEVTAASGVTVSSDTGTDYLTVAVWR